MALLLVLLALVGFLFAGFSSGPSTTSGSRTVPYRNGPTGIKPVPAPYAHRAAEKCSRGANAKRCRAPVKP
jgi:hypothetical protein